MQDKIRKARKKSIFWGMFGGIFLLSIYFAIVSVANSLVHAVNEFLQLWYWITALTIGFGIQVGFYVHVRQTIQLKKQAFGATSTMAAAGGVSTVSMLACCAHHVTDFLPILGLSAAAAFLSTYQLIFIVIGIISNIFGITYMLSIIAKHHLYFDANKWLVRIANYNYKLIFRIEIPMLILIFLVSLVLFKPFQAIPETNNILKQITLEEKQVAGNGIWVDAKGEYNSAIRTIVFTVTFTTHSGSLDFEVDKIATLTVNERDILRPAVWEGSSQGGHHISGSLHFENIPEDVKTIKLQLSAEGRLGVRNFEWILEKIGDDHA